MANRTERDGWCGRSTEDTGPSCSSSGYGAKVKGKKIHIYVNQSQHLCSVVEEMEGVHAYPENTVQAERAKCFNNRKL